MSVLIKNRKREFRNEIIFSVCLVLAIAIGVVPTYAGAVADILSTIFSWIITSIMSVIMGMLQSVAGLFLTVTSIDISTLAATGNSGLLAGFNAFSEGIRIIAVALASALFMYQLFATLWGPLFGAKQTQSIGNLIVRGLVFIPLSYFMQDIMLAIFKTIQMMYNGFLNAYRAYEGTGLFQLGTDMLDSTELTEALGTALGAGDYFMGDMVALIISNLLMILIMWNFVKFLLEMMQRFVALVVYMYLSPLAAACGVSMGGSNILKQTMTLFLSSGVLWILNIWCVGITIALFNAVVFSNVEQFFLWAVVTYGFIKIAQQLDDVFNAVGATNVRFSGSLLDDLVSMEKAVGAVAAVGSAASKIHGWAKGKTSNFAENGLGGQGNSSQNPVTPSQTPPIPNTKNSQNKPAQPNATGGKPSGQSGGQSPSGSTAKTFAGKVAEVGLAGAVASTVKDAATSTGQTVKNAAKNSMVGDIVRGTGKTVQNLEDRVNAGRAEVAAINNRKSLNGVQDALANKDTSALSAATLSNGAVLGAAQASLQSRLNPGEQVVGLSPNKSGTGLNATVQSVDSDGNVTTRKLNNVDSLTAQHAPQSSEMTLPQMATMSSVAFANGTTAQFEQIGQSVNEKGEGVAIYKGTSSTGETMQFSTPHNMEAGDIASVVAGSASAETAKAFESCGSSVGAIQEKLSGSVGMGGIAMDGESWQHSPSTSFSMTNPDTGESVTMSRTASGDTDTWTARNTATGVEVGQIEVASGTGAHSVMSEVMSSDSISSATIRDAARIQQNDTRAVVGFSEAPPSASNAEVSEQVGSVYSARVGASGVDVSYSTDSGATAEATIRESDTKGSTKAFTVEYTDKDGLQTATIELGSDATIEDVAAAIAHKDGRGDSGIRDVRKKLGINTMYDDDDSVSIRNQLRKCKSNKINSEENPLGDED